jgi:hypothetical protein
MAGMGLGGEGIVRMFSWLLGAVVILACLSAPVSLLTRKGSRIHRAAGRTYFALVALMALLAAGLAFIQGAVFVAAVSLFSLQAALSGIRSPQIKYSRQEPRVSRWDWLTTLLFLSLSSGMTFVGLRDTLDMGTIEDIALLVVGGMGVTLSLADLWKFRSPPRAPWHWFSEHIGAMLASYAATLSAFSAIHLTALPLFLRLLWPSLVVAPLLVTWVALYERRFAEGVKPHDVAEVTEEPPVTLTFSDDSE